MKKVITLLFVLLGILTFTNKFDEYESKKALDIFMDFYMNFDAEKYMNDPKLRDYIKGNYGNMDGENDYDIARALNLIRPFRSIRKYEVLSVKEDEDKSLIKLRITYEKAYEIDKSKKELIAQKTRELIQEFEKYDFSEKNENIVAIEGMTRLANIINPYVKYRDETKEIEVILVKSEELGIWKQNYQGNEFTEIIFSKIASPMLLLEKLDM